MLLPACFISLLTIAFSADVSNSSLATLYAYKNTVYDTHAYCTNAACIGRVKNEGFTASKTAIGRIIANTTAAYNAAVAACPTATFNPLGFVKKRRGYMHNLNGYGLRVGYVPLVAACGATKPMKAYNHLFGDDIWYTTGASKLRVRHGGRVLFYVW